jgi:zinc/manganese transport system permease protein
MLVGGLLTISGDEVVKFAIVYAAIGALHWLIRRPLLAAADMSQTAPDGGKPLLWDLVFYLSFGVVVTSSVSVAGVLLVFCFLIVPALIGTLFTSRIGGALAIGWFAGAIASAAGIFGSFVIDAPTGALTVVAFAVALVVAGAIRAFVVGPMEERSRNRRRGARAGAMILCAALALSGLWAIVAPAGDHPLLAAIESVTGIGPERFMTGRERQDYLEAIAVERRHKNEIDRLYALERQSRWQGDALDPDAIRRIGSVQQSLTEMGRGERFVMDYLRTRARERGRWYFGLPLLAVGIAGLAALAAAGRRKPRPA